MIFYTFETYITLGLASLPAIVSLFCYFAFDKKKWALFLLLLSAFLLRLTMISLDAFLHDWDERFHALVAKNMINDPFVPMLRVNPVLDFDYKAWCCNHIWVHKQPLFLWQMAISMKVFGVHEITMRLPSAIMGTIMVFFTQQIAVFWTKNKLIAYLSAFLTTFSYFQLELISGRFPLDHNDLAFTFYLTASIWAWMKYLQSELTSLKWIIGIGLFLGAAILIKWLTALVVIGGWGLYLLQDPKRRFKIKYYGHITLTVLIAVFVFLPWQIYILDAFPLESAAVFDSNRRHIFEVLDNQGGDMFFHIDFLPKLYGVYVIPFLLFGTYSSYNVRGIDRKLTVSFIAIVLVVYGFFSIIVATKMQAFTYPVAALMTIFIAIGMNQLLCFFTQTIKPLNVVLVVRILFFALISIRTFRPISIANHRASTNFERNDKIHNTQIYKNFDMDKFGDRMILNIKQFEDVEMMFYQNINAHPWYPSEQNISVLKQKGHLFAAFEDYHDQCLPDYIEQDSSIVKLSYRLR